METLLNFFKLNNIEFRNKTFVLTVSTGIDSSVLLDKFIKLSKIEPVRIIVAHVNHNRRSESLQEKEYITKYCESLNIKCYTIDFNFAIDTNFQAVAHKARYKFFNDVMETEQADYLVLAHHAGDNAETVLMRLIRGSSLAGYAGIRASYRVLTEKAYAYHIIRPMINLTKDEIINYQKLNNVKYFEDSSNSHNDYERNRIRHNVIPELIKENPDFYHKINEFSATIREAAIIVNGIRDNYITDFVKIDTDIYSFTRSSFLQLSPYMRQEVLFELLKRYDLSKALINDLLNIIDSDKANYNNVINGLFNFVIEYDNVKIINSNILNKLKNIDIMINDVGIYCLSDDLEIIVEKINKNCNANLMELCYNKLPIEIRTRRDGDKIKLKPGYKKINDLFIDKKIPQRSRDEVILALDPSSSNNEVLIAFGLRKSELLKEVNDSTYKISLVTKK